MLRWLPAPLKAVFAALCVALNTLLVFIAFLPFALLKLCLPASAVRRFADRCLNALADGWVRINQAWMYAIERHDWRISGVDDLKPRGWYVVGCNHQSWADILVLQSVFRGRIPFLKFFLKHELIYIPVIGLAWWALDFPFMRRSGKTLAANAADMATARKSCEKFRFIPTSVINFLEGTRYTPAKHKQQRSPYQHLLKPKSGGLSIALGTMGELFESMLDVTIVYPDRVPSFGDLICGRLGRVIVEVRQLPIPAEFVGEAASRDPQFRSNIQTWLNGLWLEKDQRIGELRRQAGVE
ncbi:MAG: acyltransferase [Candidatus Dactylopiibacterium carminicum]|uniref:Acyltransferase n=1 Tax=Candidatus Dactylopiibacterium carminicum TaxID=857335 RepID=A0A272ERE7_9RHOO|nr:acyltransferase [Candidatus Dactylopiibacterium carminicum]KAF7598795.1 acyltransferase [Candidatus Dactylopiibacterium carminicum]PAS92678.1 MAG: acyltransferase [Candidatus Dactylopiibacterium carminicum]PAS98815.1 MAG: acyltransferase [Candidatus Dactylopiibacterium carminicum]